jgi:hypothetical protein
MVQEAKLDNINSEKSEIDQSDLEMKNSNGSKQNKYNKIYKKILRIVDEKRVDRACF